MTNHLISVVIPTRNHKRLLSRLLESVSSQSMDPAMYEVIVVDDGSTDGSRELLRGIKVPFSLRVLAGNRIGPPSARNKGAGQARASILAFMDDDVLLREDCLERVARYFDDPLLGIVETNLLIEGTDQPLQRNASTQGFVTAAIFFRKDVFDEVGGFDPEFFDPETGNFFRDDSDLGFRVMKSGCKAVQPDDVIAWHPPLFPSLKVSFAHGRRYLFDPLLYRKHPRFYREFVERKQIGPFSFGRPMHYACVAYVLCVGFTIDALLGSSALFVVPASLALGFLTIVRFKFQQQGAFRIWRINEVLAYSLFPLWYLYWFLRGCLKFGGWKAIF